MNMDAAEFQASLSFDIFHFNCYENSVQLSAPAKTNLSLEVRGKRADGFHEIETLMVPISLADTITLDRADGEGVIFTCSDPSLPTGKDNLVVRAARLFFERTGILPGVHIHLEKRVPHGAGLGGGSSDAATTLIGLNVIIRHQV